MGKVDEDEWEHLFKGVSPEVVSRAREMRQFRISGQANEAISPADLISPGAAANTLRSLLVGKLAAGGVKATSGFAPRAFKTGEDAIHFAKHGEEIAKQLGIKNYSAAQYVDDANWGIQYGKFAPEINAYVSVAGGRGGAKGLMVGIDRVTGEITTMHLRPVSFFERNAPSLGWQSK
jgi:hypothetical protein